jgi:hypothetical protein
MEPTPQLLVFGSVILESAHIHKNDDLQRMMESLLGSALPALLKAMRRNPEISLGYVSQVLASVKFDLTRRPRVNGGKNGGFVRKRSKNVNPETDLKIQEKYHQMRRYLVIPNITIEI